MKNSILVLFLAMGFISCGKSNKVNTTAETPIVNGLENFKTNFEGNYDLIRMDSNDCGSSIQIVRACDGLKLLSNHLGPEEFCNINKGEMRSITVTLNDNELKSVVTLENGRNDPRNPQNKIRFTNILTLKGDGTLIKMSNLKSRMSRCVYLKR